MLEAAVSKIVGRRPPPIGPRFAPSSVASRVTRPVTPILGWRVLAWTLATGGDDVADAVCQHRDADCGAPPRSVLSPAEARAAGRAGQRNAASLSAELGESARRRVAALVASSSA
jgi:hypothetical protein